MARTMTRIAELAPDPPRDYAEFEVFIRELDAGRVSFSANVSRAAPARRFDCFENFVFSHPNG